MTELTIGIAGLGTVGTETFRIITQETDLLSQRCGKTITIKAVSARSKDKDRGISLDNVTWYDNAVDMAADPTIELVVELIGGSEGTAYELCEQALQNGKSVVTANKALIAQHGNHLSGLAEKNQKILAFEAAVAGGIPIIKSLKEGLAANHIHQVSGILNGTCNYILTKMTDTGEAFEDILKDAQELGYAEADPTFDIAGIDAAHKITILSSLAFGTNVSFDDTIVEGITSITASAIEHAKELGYAIKLLGICKQQDGKILQAVYPCLVSKDIPIASVDDVFNAVAVKGDAVGDVMLVGPGAGAGPTASAVIADIMDVAAGRTSYPFNMPSTELKAGHYISLEERVGQYYLAIAVQDTAGILAEITEILSQNDISTQSIIQKPDDDEKTVEIIIITHNAVEKQINDAIKHINALDPVQADVVFLRVES